MLIFQYMIIKPFIKVCQWSVLPYFYTIFWNGRVKAHRNCMSLWRSYDISGTWTMLQLRSILSSLIHDVRCPCVGKYQWNLLTDFLPLLRFQDWSLKMTSPSEFHCIRNMEYHKGLFKPLEYQIPSLTFLDIWLQNNVGIFYRGERVNR